VSEGWTALDYERHKRRFVESRLLRRNLHLHASLIFAGTLAVGWVCSWALLTLGMASLPLRYAISFAASYAVFLLLVRWWADFMRTERDGDIGWTDVMQGADLVSAGTEGCFFIVGLWLVGLVAAGVFAMIGGMPLLLEVAFEVVFAGVIVRRARRSHVVGDWLGALLARTWMHALVTGLLLVGVAAYVQHKVPQAHTLREALSVLLK
jgi:hypothetical protein